MAGTPSPQRNTFLREFWAYLIGLILPVGSLLLALMLLTGNLTGMVASENGTGDEATGESPVAAPAIPSPTATPSPVPAQTVVAAPPAPPADPPPSGPSPAPLRGPAEAGVTAGQGMAPAAGVAAPRTADGVSVAGVQTAPLLGQTGGAPFPQWPALAGLSLAALGIAWRHATRR